MEPSPGLSALNSRGPASPILCPYPRPTQNNPCQNPHLHPRLPAIEQDPHPRPRLQALILRQACPQPTPAQFPPSSRRGPRVTAQCPARP